ncbi:MAG: YeaH/YhbH family protein [Planctomycetota bacterium]
MNIIDRRINPKSKSLGNRQRFLRRARGHMRRVVHDAIRDGKVADVGKDGKVSIPTGGDLSEPTFQIDRETGKRFDVLPGNRHYQKGDRIRRPESGSGGRGNEGSADGDGEDPFTFLLRREEFLDLFFEDLELPNLVKKQLKKLDHKASSRAGFRSDGPPNRLNVTQTMRRSMARRIALGRPRQSTLDELVARHQQAIDDDDAKTAAQLEEEIRRLQRRQRQIPYLDDVDLRYDHFVPTPRPTTQAVMFCLMDTSASMTEDLKGLAKRFYILLHLFLQRHYRNVEIVFIRHTYTAAEVDEQTFFHGRDTGGTIVSSALDEMRKVIQRRYPVNDWNIYAAQASDGHNFHHDMPETMRRLQQEILPLCQYYAYIEVGDDLFQSDSVLWEAYQPLAAKEARFEIAKVAEASDIYSVFRSLFERNGTVSS